MEYSKDIFEYITQQEAAYKLPINVMDWQWSMKDHIKTTFFYKHGRLLTGNTDDKPVKNITKPILDLQYRTEDLDVKDVLLYVDDPERFHLSFLVKKYHDEVFIKKYNIDSFIDEINVERIDMGGGLCKTLPNTPRPECVPLQSIAFCDQTSILSGPIGLKHYYAPDELLEMASVGWGDESKGATISLEDLIVLSRDVKKDADSKETKTPGKYIEIYEVHGMFPESWLYEDGDENIYCRQLHIVAFYKNKETKEQSGVCLFKGKEKELPFKLVLRDPIFGRALGFGGAEEIFEDQVWINYDIIRMKDLLDAASKIIFQTNDETLAARHPNGLKNMDNLEMVVVGDGKQIAQLNTFPANIQLFDRSVAEWEVHAQQMGAANDALMGKAPTAGTPFKLQELVTAEGHGLHDYRRGQFAKFIEEVYRDWILPYIVKEITKDQKFLATLSLDEMQKMADTMITNHANNFIKEKILNGEEIDPAEVEQLKITSREQFMKSNQKFIEIWKGDFEDVPLSISINVAGKQKDLSGRTDKLVNIFRQIAAGPQILEQPGMADLFNQIIEGSGLNPIDFSGFKLNPAPQPIQQPNNQLNQPMPAQTGQDNQPML